MLAFSEPSYSIRGADKSEAGLIAYLRLASLLSLEMPSQGLKASRSLMTLMPDVSANLIASGRYFVADSDGDLIGGAGWSVLPLRFPAGRLTDQNGAATPLTLAKNSVLVRGFFLDPDIGRRGVGAKLLGQIEAEIVTAGFACAEIVAPHSAQVYYRTLGFKAVARLNLAIAQGEELRMVQMRKCLFLRLAAAA